jgi:glutaryl-CoA dehydrogenase
MAAEHIDRLDLLDLRDDLDGEDRLLRDTVAKFCDGHTPPHIQQWFEDGELPARDLALEFGKLGVLGITSTATAAQAAAPPSTASPAPRIEAVDSGLRSLVSVQGSLAMFAIHGVWQRGAEKAAVAATHGARGASSAASASPSRTPAPTRAACAPRPHV